MCLQKSKLDRHVENEACNKPKHICPMCSTEFTNNQSLTNHIIKEHPQQAAHLLPDLRCFRCSKLFSRVNLWLRLFFLFFWKFLRSIICENIKSNTPPSWRFHVKERKGPTFVKNVEKPTHSKSTCWTTWETSTLEKRQSSNHIDW